MFCPKCGTNAGDGIFCPNCGNMMPVINGVVPPVQPEAAPATPVTPAAETPETPAVETPVTPVAETPVTPAVESPVQPAPAKPKVQQTVTSASQVRPAAQQPSFNDEPVMKKKKKKWPVFVGIFAAVAVIAAVIFFAWPAIEGIISPKSKAVKALKSTTAGLRDSSNFMTGGTSGLDMNKNRLTGTYKLDSLVIGGEDIAKDIKTEYVMIDSEQDMTSGCFAGTIKLGPDSQKSVLSIEYYMNGNKLYFKIPEIDGAVFYVPVDMGDINFGNVQSGMQSVDPSQLEAYKPYIEAMMNDIVDALDDFWENIDYDYEGKDVYHSSNGDIDIRKYKITIKEEHVKQLIKDLISNILDDKELSTFTSLLAMTGYNEEMLLNSIDTANLNMPDFKFEMDINKSGEIVRLMLDLADYSNQSGTMSVGFIGKDKITDMIEFEVVTSDVVMKGSVATAGDAVNVKFEMTPDQTKNPGEFLEFDLKMSGNTDSIKIEYMNFNGNFGDGETVEFSCSGESRISTFVSLSKSASQFRGAKDLENMDYSDMLYILGGSRDVLENVVSDKWLESIVPEQKKPQELLCGTWVDNVNGVDNIFEFKANMTGRMAVGSSVELAYTYTCTEDKIVIQVGDKSVEYGYQVDDDTLVLTVGGEEETFKRK